MSDRPRTVVCVKRSASDVLLHGYCGEVIETVGQQFRVRFFLKIRNERDEALVPIVDCRPV